MWQELTEPTENEALLVPRDEKVRTGDNYRIYATVFLVLDGAVCKSSQGM